MNEHNSLQEFIVALKDWIYKIMPVFIGVGVGILVSLLLA